MEIAFKRVPADICLGGLVYDIKITVRRDRDGNQHGLHYKDKQYHQQANNR